MKNILKISIVLFILLTVALPFANAQNSNSAEKVSVSKQAPAPQTQAAEKFFNITTLDEKRNAVETASVNYKQSPADKAEALHLEYRIAIRYYTVELEKQMSAYDKTTETGQKIRAEMKRISTAD